MSSDDILSMPLRQLLAGLVPASQADEWVDPHSDACPVPGRAVLDAGRRGELPVRKVGRKVLVRRSALDAWIDSHPIDAADCTASEASAKPTAAEITLARAGYRRRG